MDYRSAGSKDGWWKPFAYAKSEDEARKKLTSACLKASMIYMVRFGGIFND